MEFCVYLWSTFRIAVHVTVLKSAIYFFFKFVLEFFSFLLIFSHQKKKWSVYEATFSAGKNAGCAGSKPAPFVQNNLKITVLWLPK